MPQTYQLIGMSGLFSSVRRTFASKLKGPGFKSQSGTLGAWSVHYNNNNNIGCSARRKTSFELNPVKSILWVLKIG